MTFWWKLLAMGISPTTSRKPFALGQAFTDSHGRQRSCGGWIWTLSPVSLINGGVASLKNQLLNVVYVSSNHFLGFNLNSSWPSKAGDINESWVRLRTSLKAPRCQSLPCVRWIFTMPTSAPMEDQGVWPWGMWWTIGKPWENGGKP